MVSANDSAYFVRVKSAIWVHVLRVSADMIYRKFTSAWVFSADINAKGANGQGDVFSS